jgi:hypothetical protein
MKYEIQSTVGFVSFNCEARFRLIGYLVGSAHVTKGDVANVFVISFIRS